VTARQRVGVVTGGGGGIGAAIAEELGRSGWHVVTVDPLVTLEGSEKLPEPQQTTAGRIVAAGGSARASAHSVTDSEAVRQLFQELVEERGGLDAVFNVAGITRQTGFAHGTEEDWLAVLTVHLGGYLNVLQAALPLMATAGSGRIIGVTSGSGWRAADAGAYSCAKRAIASLTWQLGRHAPPGVTVNAMSPIAATRMVAAAAERARQAGATGGGGGLNLFKSMPSPEDLGPFGAHLASDGFGWCNGRVFFAGGSEVAVVDEPRLLEVVRSEGAASVARVLEAFVPRAWARAEAGQASDGGGNPRFGPIFDEPPPAPVVSAEIRSCALVTDRRGLAQAIIPALEARSIACHPVDVARGFGDAAKALTSVADSAGPIDAVVVAPAGRRTATSRPGWERVLAEHRGIIEDIHADAGWARATADYAAGGARSVRLLTLTDATTAGGRSRAQAAAQLARVAGGTTEGRVTAFAAGIEASEQAAGDSVAELVAHLLTHPEASAVAGAELVVGDGWLGLRGHPRPIGSVTYGGPSVPAWLDATLREIVGTHEDSERQGV
jgi:NAD(P)-dependent dehydrogenase (short-subunit alcohol dehydrogenase family)